MTVFLVILAGLGLGYIARLVLTRRKRDRLMATPLTEAQRAIIAQRVPVIARLPAGLSARFEGLVNRFLDQVTFHGAADHQITDEVRLTIAAQACLLLVNKENRWFDTLETIFVYPAAFKSRIATGDGHVHQEADVARTGESWQRGSVILAWDHAAFGAFADRDGHNVVMHEFAHQLDDQTGVTDGAPLLDPDHNAREWAQAFQDAYARHTEQTARGAATLIDAYGATNPAEFFAVATEVFFERAEALREAEPALYGQLARYYRLDPAGWR